MTTRRRSAREARERILDAAIARFRQGGVDAVKVQLIAADLGITDAAVHYHFNDRRGLIEAMLRRAGRTLQLQISEIAESYRRDGSDLTQLIALFRDGFEKDGVGELALWLWLAGWRSADSGFLLNVANGIHETRDGEVPLEEVQFAVALMHMTLFADAIWGGEFRRGAGLRDTKAVKERFDRWLDRVLTGAIDGAL